MFLETFLGFLVVIFIVYFFIGIEMPGISWFSPGKWSFCASNGKISEFKTCDNKFTWTSCSQKEQEGKVILSEISCFCEWSSNFHQNSGAICIAGKVKSMKYIKNQNEVCSGQR